jgi:hypothetical protein
MSPAKPPPRSTTSNLDNLTLSRKEGWRDYVQATKRLGIGWRAVR